MFFHLNNVFLHCYSQGNNSCLSLRLCGKMYLIYFLIDQLFQGGKKNITFFYAFLENQGHNLVLPGGELAYRHPTLGFKSTLCQVQSVCIVLCVWITPSDKNVIPKTKLWRHSGRFFKFYLFYYFFFIQQFLNELIVAPVLVRSVTLIHVHVPALPFLPTRATRKAHFIFVNSAGVA